MITIFRFHLNDYAGNDSCEGNPCMSNICFRQELTDSFIKESRTASPYGQLLQEKTLQDALIEFANSFDTETQHL